MTSSNEQDKGSLENLEKTSSREVEEILRAASDGADDAVQTVALSDIGSVDFMIDDQNELVDLDALFDALNVAAKDGVDAMGYIEDQTAGTILTVTNEALTIAGVSSSIEDLGSSSSDLTKDIAISDES